MGVLKINFSESVAGKKELKAISAEDVFVIKPYDEDHSLMQFKEKISAWEESRAIVASVSFVYVKMSFNSLCHQFSDAMRSGVVLDLTEMTQTQPFKEDAPSAKP